jgi:membrane protein implicated in regulation of membrane protease activity
MSNDHPSGPTGGDPYPPSPFELEPATAHPPVNEPTRASEPQGYIQPTPEPPPGAAVLPDRPVPQATPDHPTALRAADGILRPIQDAEVFSSDPATIMAVSSHINAYFNQPLDIFPFWESEGKPDRFHVLFARQIEERFPVDEDLRAHIHAYGRRVFRALCVHVGTKRLCQLLALIGFALLATLGPTWFSQWTGSLISGAAIAAGTMLVVVGLYWGIQQVLFIQYRFRLENDSYELSREIVQRTRELQNLFTSARAMADQAETQYQMDGKGWGRRSHYLTRLTMWLAARMEYLEKYVQMELWRVRRERYWTRWVARFLTPAVFLIWLGVFLFEPAPVEAGWFRGLQVLAILLGGAVSTLSYFLWATPTAAIQGKLGVEGWVRYASLDVDDAVADQVRRDKERLVEYRALTRGR